MHVMIKCQHFDLTSITVVNVECSFYSEWKILIFPSDGNLCSIKAYKTKTIVHL